jgi:hypothetical protein
LLLQLLTHTSGRPRPQIPQEAIDTVQPAFIVKIPDDVPIPALSASKQYLEAHTKILEVRADHALHSSLGLWCPADVC